MTTVWNDIKKEYIESNGKAVLKDLADKYDVKIGTLRSRKSRDNWDKEIEDIVATDNATQRKENKNVATQKKATEIIKEVVKDIDREIAEEVIENSELTDKQQLFCVYYIKCFNATKAYQKAYGVDYVTANAAGPRMLVNVSIKEEIQRLKQGKLNRAMLSEDDIFQKMMDIAFADITDYVTFGTKEIETEIGPMTVSYVDFKESIGVDGTLISEVSKGKDGVKVKLQDKMKALQWLSDRMDLLPLATREKLEIEKIKVYGKDEEEIEDDGFIEALESEVSEVWDDVEED